MINLKLNQIEIIQKFLILILMISFSNYTLINPRKKKWYFTLLRALWKQPYSKSPTVLREAIFTTPYSGHIIPNFKSMRDMQEEVISLLEFQICEKFMKKKIIIFYKFKNTVFCLLHKIIAWFLSAMYLQSHF